MGENLNMLGDRCQKCAVSVLPIISPGITGNSPKVLRMDLQIF
jgi:hypothetical protein